MRSALLILTCSLLLAPQGDVLAQDANVSPSQVVDGPIPAKASRAIEFLEFIKYPIGASFGFDATKAPHWDLSKLMSYISKDGVAFSDVNGYISGHYSDSDIHNALETRKGELFGVFAHIAYIYSIPDKNSALKFDPTAAGAVVHIGDWYVLTFKTEDGQLKLTNCDYIEIEESD